MITLTKAKKALEAAERSAEALKTAVTTVIVDEHGTIIASSRMDGAIPISPKFAFTKAYTSANLGMPTDQIAPFAEHGKPYHGITSLMGGDITTIAGGVPIIDKGRIIGAVGVGGSQDVSQDLLCAQEAKKVLES